MSRHDYRRRLKQRRRRNSLFWRHLPSIVTVLIILAVLLGLGFGGYKFFKSRSSVETGGKASASDTVPADTDEAGTTGGNAGTDGEADGSGESGAEPDAQSGAEALISQARGLAQMYDYDGAIALLTGDTEYAGDPAVQEALKEIGDEKATLVRVNPQEITHVFFHSLIMDTSKAFDGDSREAGYNQVMTTKDEFLKIMESMYERGFVLVRLHDIAYETTDENGNVYFKEGDIMLPPGKKAFVLDYDLVPILTRFLEEHPGFPYKGAKGVLAFTGYNGILGYRTAASYSESPTYESDREMAAAVAQCLRDDGWELASHSWGHRNMGQISMENFITDTTKWENEVETLTGPCDIILFPFGSDIGDWHAYSPDNERFQYLKSVGFRYFCNVDSHQYWVQIGSDHMRQGRRNLDGYRMYYDLIDPEIDHLSDLFDVEEVFDPARPTPVPPMS